MAAAVLQTNGSRVSVMSPGNGSCRGSALRPRWASSLTVSGGCRCCCSAPRLSPAGREGRGGGKQEAA